MGCRYAGSPTQCFFETVRRDLAPPSPLLTSVCLCVSGPVCAAGSFFLQKVSLDKEFLFDKMYLNRWGSSAAWKRARHDQPRGRQFESVLSHQRAYEKHKPFFLY